MKLSRSPRQDTDERRESPRRRVYLRDASLLDGAERTLPCTIQDISEGGVRVRLRGKEAVGDEVILIDRKEGAEYRAKVVWRSAKELGLAFVGEARLGRPKSVSGA